MTAHSANNSPIQTSEGMLLMARAKLSLPAPDEGVPDLGMTATMLDDVVSTLFSQRAHVLRAVRVRVAGATLDFTANRLEPLAHVWKAWRIAKGLLTGVTAGTPMLVLADQQLWNAFDALNRIFVYWKSGGQRGVTSLLDAACSESGECAISAYRGLWSALQRHASEAHYSLCALTDADLRAEGRRLPIDIALPERQPLANGAIFATLHTLDELQQFWASVRATHPYAAQGVPAKEDQLFLTENQWVFAPTKDALVAAATRWDDIGIHCEWVPSRAGDDDTAPGRWVLTGLPASLDFDDWFDPSAPDLDDPTLEPAAAAALLRVRTFDEWYAMRTRSIEFLARDDLDRDITEWTRDRAVGTPTYGARYEGAQRH